MSILMGHASISETGGINGTAGDSTGKEVCTRTWYSKPWDFIAIYPDADIREELASLMEDFCANDCFGYGQSDRNTAYTRVKAVNWKPAKVTTNCNCDCSSLMNLICKCAGIADYGSNGWTTYTMRTQLTAAGFTILETSKYLTSSAYCVRGAIYVKESSHTAMGLTNGSSYAKTLEAAGIGTTTGGTTVATTKSVTQYAGIVKVSDYLNVRTGPGTSYDYYTLDGQKLRLPNGMVVSIDTESSDGSWGKLTNVDDAWISLDYITK